MRIAYLFIFYSILLFSVTATADAKDINDIDGTAWAEWPQTYKQTFVVGFLAGTANIVASHNQSRPADFDRVAAAKMYRSYLVPDANKPKNAFSPKEVALILGNQIETQNSNLIRYSLDEITSGQIVDGLNSFYVDFKNKQIRIRDAIYVVKTQIKGSSPEETEALLRYLRADKDVKKLFYTDKDGKNRFVRFP
ncbi:MAG: hypothetical protein IH604_06005 [Burkholderiales bacterium]|nr:hypothetical protein [Burkholderiales bacterium]